ncbi:MAG: DNA-directed RNA polymerase subunit G [Desulfurococcaceae archaeon]
MKLECAINDVVPLRIPKVYRVKSVCGDLDLEIELHEDVVEIPQKGSKLIISLSTSKDECLNYYYCAHGYVISNTKLNDIHRVVISLHGFLVVLKSKNPLEYKALDHLYLGLNLVK